MSSKFGFILVKPQLGENIGACARAMKNFGFSKLHIVEPKINFPNHKAKATSVGAYDIINKARVFNNIQDAIEHLRLVQLWLSYENDFQLILLLFHRQKPYHLLLASRHTVLFQCCLLYTSDAADE